MVVAMNLMDWGYSLIEASIKFYLDNDISMNFNEFWGDIHVRDRCVNAMDVVGWSLGLVGVKNLAELSW